MEKNNIPNITDEISVPRSTLHFPPFSVSRWNINALKEFIRHDVSHMEMMTYRTRDLDK